MWIWLAVLRTDGVAEGSVRHCETDSDIFRHMFGDFLLVFRLSKFCQSSPSHVDVDVMMFCWPGRLHRTRLHVKATHEWNNTDNQRNERNEKTISVSSCLCGFRVPVMMMMVMIMPIQSSSLGAPFGQCDQKSAGGWKRFCMAYKLRWNAADPEFTIFRVCLPPATILYVIYINARVPRLIRHTYGARSDMVWHLWHQGTPCSTSHGLSSWPACCGGTVFFVAQKSDSAACAIKSAGDWQTSQLAHWQVQAHWKCWFDWILGGSQNDLDIRGAKWLRLKCSVIAFDSRGQSVGGFPLRTPQLSQDLRGGNLGRYRPLSRPHHDGYWVELQKIHLICRLGEWWPFNDNSELTGRELLTRSNGSSPNILLELPWILAGTVLPSQEFPRFHSFHQQMWRLPVSVASVTFRGSHEMWVDEGSTHSQRQCPVDPWGFMALDGFGTWKTRGFNGRLVFNQLQSSQEWGEREVEAELDQADASWGPGSRWVRAEHIPRYSKLVKLSMSHSGRSNLVIEHHWTVIKDNWKVGRFREWRQTGVLIRMIFSMFPAMVMNSENNAVWSMLTTLGVSQMAASADALPLKGPNCLVILFWYQVWLQNGANFRKTQNTHGWQPASCGFFVDFCGSRHVSAVNSETLAAQLNCSTQMGVSINGGI